MIFQKPNKNQDKQPKYRGAFPLSQSFSQANRITVFNFPVWDHIAMVQKAFVLIVVLLNLAVSQTAKSPQANHDAANEASTMRSLECVVAQVQDNVITLSQLRREYDGQSRSKPAVTIKDLLENIILDQLWIEKSRQLGNTVETQEICHRIELDRSCGTQRPGIYCSE